jgi:hypothetical protein
VIFAKFLQGSPHPACIGDQGGDINPLALSGYMAQIPGATLQQADGTPEVAVLPVVQRHRNLDDALVKITNLSLFAYPEIFYGLVAFKPLTVVKLPYALQQLSGRGFITLSLHG